MNKANSCAQELLISNAKQFQAISLFMNLFDYLLLLGLLFGPILQGCCNLYLCGLIDTVQNPFLTQYLVHFINLS